MLFGWTARDIPTCYFTDTYMATVREEGQKKEMVGQHNRRLWSAMSASSWCWQSRPWQSPLENHDLQSRKWSCQSALIRQRRQSIKWSKSSNIILLLILLQLFCVTSLLFQLHQVTLGLDGETYEDCCGSIYSLQALPHTQPTSIRVYKETIHLWLDGLLHSNLSCGQSMASLYNHTSSPHCATTQSQHKWTLGIRRCCLGRQELSDDLYDLALSTDSFRRLIKTHLFSDY